jgi:hypothetical protein
MLTAELVVPETNYFELEIAVEKLKRYKSPGIDQILAERIQALRSEIHILIYSIWNKEEMPQQCKDLSLYLFIDRVIKLTVVIIEGYHCYQLLHTKFHPLFLFQG